MKKLLYAAGIIFVLGVAYFAYYTISPIFRSVKIDEAAPPGVVPQVQTTGITEEGQSQQTRQIQDVSANVVGTTGHPASGTVRIVEGEGKRYARYEDFKTINGPDLYVYLAKDLDAKEYVNLGTLRATEGNVNYEIPTNVNLSDYRYIMIWCKQFGVLFNYADISKISHTDE